jgi:hypothetical protein
VVREERKKMKERKEEMKEKKEQEKLHLKQVVRKVGTARRAEFGFKRGFISTAETEKALDREKGSGVLSSRCFNER